MFMNQLFLNARFLMSAYAQEAAPAAPGKGPSILEQALPFVAFFAIFYFFVIRPQSKRHREHQNFISQLKRGDSVITSGGIFGKVEGINEQFVSLEVADGVQIRILKSQVSSTLKDGAANVSKS